MSFAPVAEVKVSLDFGDGTIALGRLAIRDRTIYFEYNAAFVSRGLDVSPQQLTLQPGVRSFDCGLFEGLPGLFNDSLPDGWGRLLFDRAMRAQGVLPETLSPLDRLAHVGHSGMGALVYEPDYSEARTEKDIDLNWLAARTREVLQGDADEVLRELLALNGSSAGARPKAIIAYSPSSGRIVHGADTMTEDFEPWLVKFANTQDGPDAGAIEQVYAEMAGMAGLDMMATHLFPSRHGAGYFATQRFDREGGNRLHMHTVCGILHSDFRTPCLDYQDLLALTTILTRDVRETEKMYRLAVFNVLAHNRDDHSKNFTFLMDANGEWRVSPAYDLTFCSGPGGEQSTLVMGEGKAPGVTELTKLGVDAGIKQHRIKEIMEQTRAALSAWTELAKVYGVTAANVKLIKGRINEV